jgi:hypothetical protein
VGALSCMGGIMKTASLVSLFLLMLGAGLVYKYVYGP